jgi:tetratricopeptide (TPR) repeat protein
MKKTIVATMSYIFLIISPALGQDAMHLYNLGLESSMANKKIQYFTKALELNPGLAAAYEKRGLLYYFQGKYSKMMQDFQKLTELEPSKPEAHLMLGLARMKRGSYDHAVDSLTRAIGLSPHLARAYGHRAEAYRLKGMVDTGQATGRAYATRAKAYEQLGQSELAQEDLKRSLRLDPSFFFYIHPTMTDFLASFALDSKYVSSEGIRRIGLGGIIALLFVLIFKLAIPVPKKDDDS